MLQETKFYITRNNMAEDLSHIGLGDNVAGNKLVLVLGESTLFDNLKYSRIELIIEGNIEDFKNENKKIIIDVISKLLDITEDEVRITKIRRGSVIIEFKLKKIHAEKLLKLFKDGKLKIIETNVIGVNIVQRKPDSESTEEEENFRFDSGTEVETVGEFHRLKIENTGIVKFFNETKGFGFITEESTEQDIFFYTTGIIDQIRKNDLVKFEVVAGKRGLSAINVKKMTT